MLRRLELLETDEQRRWSARFTELGLSELELSGIDPSLLARIERDFPATEAAALAALRLADQALEVGHADPEAATWIERGLRHARLAATGDVEAALSRRGAFVLSLRDESPEPRWTNAQSLELEHSFELNVTATRRRRAGEGFSRGLLAGAARLDDGRLVVQHPVAVFIVEEDGVGPLFKPSRLLDVFGSPGGRTFVPSGQAWPHRPLAVGSELVFVLGRAIVPGNASTLCRVRPPGKVGEAARLRWALSSEGHADEQGTITPLESLLEPGTWEFQPGPCLRGSTLVVQARQWVPSTEGAAETIDLSNPRAWVLALDVATGLPRWTRFLGKGTDVRRDLGSRFTGNGQPAAPAAPLVANDHSVFCPTGLGVAALVDIADGRIAYSYRTRRREAEQTGWVAAHAPHLVRSGDSEAFLYGPADSDFLYWLRAEADVENRGLLLQLPVPIGGARASWAASRTLPACSASPAPRGPSRHSTRRREHAVTR